VTSILHAAEAGVKLGGEARAGIGGWGLASAPAPFIDVKFDSAVNSFVLEGSEFQIKIRGLDTKWLPLWYHRQPPSALDSHARFG